MDYQEIAVKTKVEHSMLKSLMDGLQLVMSWEVTGADCSRKLSTLRFITQSFHRHLSRLLALEQYDGYMNLVQSATAHLNRAVQGLQAEHEQFRGETSRIVQKLDRLPATDPAALHVVCEELRALLRKIEDHSRKEIDLIQEALVRDGGGEG